MEMHPYLPDNRTKGMTVLRQAQLVMLRILRLVDVLCRRHAIQYWLDGGSALGALRHGGFIPWDDDLDICMLRQDYQRFLAIAETELPPDLFLQVHGKDIDYCLHWTKIRDKYSTAEEAAYTKARFHKGIGIDIFPCDFFPESRLPAGLEKSLAKALRYRKKNLHGAMCFGEKLIFITSKILCTLISPRLEKALFASIARRYPHSRQWIGYGVGTPFPGRYAYNDIFPLREMLFEGYVFPVPHRVEEYLFILYGDYTRLPPPHRRRSHCLRIDPFHPCNHEDILFFPR